MHVFMRKVTNPTFYLYSYWYKARQLRLLLHIHLRTITSISLLFTEISSIVTFKRAHFATQSEAKPQMCRCGLIRQRV